MKFLSRLSATYTTSKASSLYYSTYGALLVALLILPLLEIVFSVLFAADLGTKNYTRTALAATIVGTSTGVMGGIVGKIVRDRNLGVFHEVCRLRKIDLAYWIGSSIIPITLVIPPLLISVAVVYTFDTQLNPSTLTILSVFTVVAIITGFLLGISMAGIGVYFDDPYQGANIAGAIIPLLSGVIVPLVYYPEWLKLIAIGIPLTRTISALSETLEGNPFSYHVLFADILIAAGWSAVGMLMIRISLYRSRNGYKYDSL